MRVALLSHNARAGDAVGNQLAEKLAFFLDRGADVRVFVESDQRLHPAVRPHCHLVAKPEPRGEGWLYVSTADLVVVEYTQFYPLLGLLPLLAGGRPRILFDYHGITPTALWGSHNREALEQGARQRGLVWCAEAAVVHSRFTQRELAEHTGFPPDRVRRLGHAVDTEHFCPGRPARPLRQALGLENATLLLFVGRLAPNKRIPVLIEALARLRDRMPAVHAVVIGDTSDLYQNELHACRDLAQQRGVADRLHFLGHVSENELRDAYRSADVFVMPSRHEGFCIPVAEALACGLPVVAARAGALPETVGTAGLTFAPDNAEDLARQLLRIIGSRQPAGEEYSALSTPYSVPGTPDSAVSAEPVPPSAHAPQRIAIVACRYGPDIVGGAETSLRTIADALHTAGHHVEVFTTCTREESAWVDQLPEGTTACAGIPVHRFRIDPHDRERHLATVQTILQADGAVADEMERDYVRYSLHSTRLVEHLRQRLDEFDAIVAGPYLFGLTLAVAGAFPEKTLLLPCFHDEPFARLRVVRETYDRVAGILYHSPEEQEFAEVDLGLNHPRASCVGTFLDTTAGDQARGRSHVPADRRYLVYCGRYSQQKGLPALLDYAHRYQAAHPDRFAFVFLGRGEVPIPSGPWACDLGFVDEAVKRDLLAGAAALLQPSCYESLSLTALEAWVQGTPVLADGRSAVLAGHLERGGGGRAFDGYESFAALLDDLWRDPFRWQALGRRGRDHVRGRYGDRVAFTAALEEAVRSLSLPLAECMRRRGPQQAAVHARLAWRTRFARLIEDLLDDPPRPCREQVEIRPRTSSRTVAPGLDVVLVPVRVINRGTHALAQEGPARVVVRCTVVDEASQPAGRAGAGTPLPALLLPGRALAAAVPVPVPAVPGMYRVTFHAASVVRGPLPQGDGDGPATRDRALSLVVQGTDQGAAPACCAPMLDAVQAALAEAGRHQRLPDGYTDVTEGLFATWKRWIKRKLLGNFQRAYVDVLSRQQSACNQQLVTAVAELSECCATLDHAGRHLGDKELDLRVQELAGQLAETRQRCAALEERLAQLEAGLAPVPLVAEIDR
jgi:glycosyltransferase involved in cell wall biosynthesis